MRPSLGSLCALTSVLLAGLAFASPGGDPVLDAFDTEITRASKALEGQKNAPYFIGLEATDLERIEMNAEDGGLHAYAPHRRRALDVDVRVGGPDLDSSHSLRNAKEGPNWGHAGELPLGDDVGILRHGVWLKLEERIREARERWGKVEADRRTLVEEEPSDDLAPVEVRVELRPTARLEFDPKAWEEPLRRASRLLADGSEILDGSLTLRAKAENHWFASSEGTRLRHGDTWYELRVQADTIAKDGDHIKLSRSWAGRGVSALPSQETLDAGVRELVARVNAQRLAPMEPPYAGPVILSDQAAAVFIHEILGHRLEGHRLRLVHEGQTLRNLVGERILPDFLSIREDPTLRDLSGQDLNGSYAFDAQGVPVQETILVKNGVLQGFLESRAPSRKGQRSNGHARREPGRDPVSRQGVMVVQASRSLSDPELRESLRQLARKRGLAYGLYIEGIEGGFTHTGRDLPNAFNINVTEASRVYVDGRPDEAVRGLNLIGTPLVTLGRVVAAGEMHRVFNGYCGAESGTVPVTNASPALLFEEVETQRRARAQAPPPSLPPPGQDGLPSAEVK